MDLTWWILVFATFIDGVYGGMTRVFTHDSGASNLVPSGTTPVHVRRITECARICSDTTSCIGFYHSANQRSCDLNVGQNITGFVADTTATYYTYSVSLESTLASTPTTPVITTSTTTIIITTPTTAVAASTTTTTPQTTTSTVTSSTTTTTTTTTTPTTTSSKTTTTTAPQTTTQPSSTVSPFTTTSSFTAVSSSNCPASFISDIRIIGSYGNYAIKCVHHAGDHTDAQTGCSVHGMALFRPNNATKVNEVAAFLSVCAAYDATGYWTDAQRYMNEPGQPWKNSDGSSVPDLAFFSGTPENLNGQVCARLDGIRGYMLNDIECDCVYPSWGYICE